MDKGELLHLYSQTKLCCKVFQSNALALFDVAHKLTKQALHYTNTSAARYPNSQCTP